jgi:hypothetical protein
VSQENVEIIRAAMAAFNRGNMLAVSRTGRSGCSYKRRF